jgi:predicted ATPase
VAEHLYQACTRSDSGVSSASIAIPTTCPPVDLLLEAREIAAVCGLLSSHRLVTLTGSGGTGKTRLSLQVAEEMLEHFPHGAWFTELAGLGDPDLVTRTLIAALGLQESSNRSLLDQLKDYLRQKQALIVLDNCEHVIADCLR